MLIGGGFELYDFISVQALVNLSALTRDAAEAPFTFGVGFDAVTFADLSRGLFTKIFRANPIDKPVRDGDATP